MLPAASGALPAGFCPVLSVSCQKGREKATVRRGGGGAEEGMKDQEEEGLSEKRRAGLSQCVPENRKSSQNLSRLLYYSSGSGLPPSSWSQSFASAQGSG